MAKYQILIGLALVALAIVAAAFVMRPGRYSVVESMSGGGKKLFSVFDTRNGCWVEVNQPPRYKR